MPYPVFTVHKSITLNPLNPVIPMKLKQSLLILSAAGAASLASAQVTLVTDDFSGYTGALTGKTGGSGWNGAYVNTDGTAPNTTNSNTLFGNAGSGYVDINSGTGQLTGSVTTGYNNNRDSRSISGSALTSGDIWFSFVAAAASGAQINLYLDSINNTSPRFGVNGGNLFVRNDSTTTEDTSAFPSTFNVLVIGRLDLNTSGSNDNLTAWAWNAGNKTAITLSSLGTDANRTATTGSSDFLTDFDNIGWTLSSGTQVDQFRLAYGGTAAQNLESVLTGAAVPEPSAYAALAGLLALGLVAFRRKRS